MDINYFIEKFTATPDENWTIYSLVNESGQCCVLGLCGLRYLGNCKFSHTPESNALVKMFVAKHMNIAHINNGTHPAFQEKTPKARVLAALEYLEESGCA